MPRHAAAAGTERPDLLRCAHAVALTLAVAAVLAACAPSTTAPDGPSDSPPDGLPAGVSIELVQLRSDVAARHAQVQVRNDGESDLSVGALTVSDPRFAEPAARVLDRESLVKAGGTVDIRIQLPAMNCDAPDTGGSTARLTYTVGDAGSATAEAPLVDPLDVLGPLHERECRAAAVADAAALSLSSFTPSPAGQPADLVLAIAPTGAGAATVVGIQTTNLLTFGTAAGDTADTYPIGVAVAEGDTQTTEVHLPLVPLRCDPHAVQEDKRGTIFTLEVELDGVPGEIELAASEDMRGSILTWVSNWCGFGSG